MEKRLCIPLLCLIVFTGCSPRETPAGQTYSQVGSCFDLPADKPAEDTPVRAVWIPVMQYADWMTGKTEAQFRESIRDAFTNCQDLGIGTVFVHVRAYQDAYYDSEIFPKGAYLTGDYDPLRIMTEEGHAAGLSVHAWVNPLRAMTADRLSQLDPGCILRKWYDAGTYLSEVDGRYWLDPAYPEVRELCCQGAAEILEHYDVDGIHIDDYFYPTQDESFDAAAFAESGASDLGVFRRANCDALVQALYGTVKSCKPDCCFSVSPQGNPDADYSRQYADALRWAQEPGYCDWIIPQLYYGFENQTCPFAETLAVWEKSAVSAKLVVGLAAYKSGQEDPWAGSGQTEWLTDPEVLSRETALVLEEGLGIAYYDYASLFESEANAEERKRIAGRGARAGELARTGTSLLTDRNAPKLTQGRKANTAQG